MSAMPGACADAGTAASASAMSDPETRMAQVNDAVTLFSLS